MTSLPLVAASGPSPPTNFILVGAPDFVLLVAADRPALHPLGRPHDLNPAFAELVQLLGIAHREDRCSSPLMFDPASIRAMRRILGRYGFDLPPLTACELYGLLAYCDRLDALTGRAVFAADQLSHWQTLSEGLDCGRISPSRRAVGLYASGDLHRLRGLHRERDTLARLGVAYRDIAEGCGRCEASSA